MPVPQDQKTPFFAIFAFPLRSLRLKALVFGRKYEKLVTAKFAKNCRQGRKEKLSTLGDLDPLGSHDLRDPRGRRRVAAALRAHEAVNYHHPNSGQISRLYALQNCCP